MQAYQGNLITRDDTILGVCQGLGEDLGFNPLWLRVAFAVGIYLNPTVALAVYLGLGAIVLFSRLVAPNPRRAKMVEQGVVGGEPAPAAASGNSQEELAIAA